MFYTVSPSNHGRQDDVIIVMGIVEKILLVKEKAVAV